MFGAPKLQFGAKRNVSQRGRGLGQYSAIASAIQTIEGWFPGSRSYRSNNPGNLMYAGQPGATGADAQGFAIFPDYQTGLNALNNQIALDASRGMTIQQFAHSYAPAAGGNNPTSYAAQLASASGLSVNDPLSSASGGGFDLSSLFPSSTDNSVSSASTSDSTVLYLGLGLGAAALALAVLA